MWMFCLALLSPDSHRPPPSRWGGCLIPIKNNLIRSIPTISFTNRVNRGGCGCVSEWAQRLSGIYPILTHEFNNWIHFHSNGPLILSVDTMQGIHQTPTSSLSKTALWKLEGGPLHRIPACLGTFNNPITINVCDAAEDDH